MAKNFPFYVKHGSWKSVVAVDTTNGSTKFIYGVKPDHIMVYMLIGYWPGETEADREYRRLKLREFGCRPYPMAYERTRELQGFQRWVIGAYDKRISWDRWKEAKYRPENLHPQGATA